MLPVAHRVMPGLRVLCHREGTRASARTLLAFSGPRAAGHGRDVGLYLSIRGGETMSGDRSTEEATRVRALMIGLLVVVMVAAGCSGDDDDTASDASSTTAMLAPSVTEAATATTSVQEMEVSTTTAPPAEVIEGAFTFADDDLCEWVSEEKVAEFVGTEFDDPDVTVVLDENSGGPENPDSCQWWFLASTAPDGFGIISAGNAEFLWTDVNGVNHEYAEVDVVEFVEEAGLIDSRDGAVSGHPSLSDGVVFFDEGWGLYTFWVPPSDEYLHVSVSFPYEDRLFGVADRFVQELGWLG